MCKNNFGIIKGEDLYSTSLLLLLLFLWRTYWCVYLKSHWKNFIQSHFRIITKSHHFTHSCKKQRDNVDMHFIKKKSWEYYFGKMIFTVLKISLKFIHSFIHSFIHIRRILITFNDNEFMKTTLKKKTTIKNRVCSE